MCKYHSLFTLFNGVLQLLCIGVEVRARHQFHKHLAVTSPTSSDTHVVFFFYINRLYYEERLLVVAEKKTRTSVCTYGVRIMPTSSVSVKSVDRLLLRETLHFHYTKIHVLVTRKWT
jgi:hypothetical protein